MYLEYKKEILEEAKSLLIKKDIMDCDCISLYSVAKLLRKFYKDYNNIEKKYKNILEDNLKKTLGWTANIIISNFDYKNKELPVGVKVKGNTYNKAFYTKENGKLELSKTKDNPGKLYLEDYEYIISDLYDELLPFEKYKNNNICVLNITPINSNFKVNIYNYKVDIFIPTNNSLHDYFKLEALSIDNVYNCNSVDKEIEEIFSNIEERYLKKVFVKIEDCPTWMQEELYKIRQEQLKPKEENTNKSEKKLIKKIFTFLNK